MNTKIQNYINHIVFVVDKSGSMYSLTRDVVKVFDNQIKHLATRSKELNQETRVSVYLFGQDIECLLYDMDVMRLPSLADHYFARGQTALISGTIQAVNDLKLTPQMYGDHAFLVYVLTDGEENFSTSINPNHTSGYMASVIAQIPENWTIAVLVPNQTGVYEAKKFGFPEGNISIWSTTSSGIEQAGNVMRTATEAFMTGRKAGIRGTRSLFTKVDTSNLKAPIIEQTLNVLPLQKYVILEVFNDASIRPFVQDRLNIPYSSGMAYYLLTKTEEVQPYKLVCVRDKTNNKVYTGTNARQLIGLPNAKVRLNPGDVKYSNFEIFIQSTSVNRKLLKGTKALVMV